MAVVLHPEERGIDSRAAKDHVDNRTMDNLCHTLLGAAVGQAGLKARTRLGNPILMVTANLPDLDVLAFASATPAVAIRRGWTHGILAQALLPIIFTGLVLLLDRLLRPAPGTDRARWADVLLLSYVGVLSHVALDWLNNYGIRLLMPFSGRWFYGDAVFIMDPWLWLILGFGVFVARRLERPAMALVALLIATLYVCGMVWSARWARQYVAAEWNRRHGAPPRSLMVGPVPVNPLRRTIIIDTGDHYRTGTLFVLPPRVVLDDRPVPRNEDTPAAARARQEPRVRAVLLWARFPFYQLTPVPGGTRVTLADMRFGTRVGTIDVVVPGD